MKFVILGDFGMTLNEAIIKLISELEGDFIDKTFVFKSFTVMGPAEELESGEAGSIEYEFEVM